MGCLLNPLPLSQGHKFGSQDNEVRGGRVSEKVGATSAFCHPSGQASMCNAACGPAKSLAEMKQQVSHVAGRREKEKRREEKPRYVGDERLGSGRWDLDPHLFKGNTQAKRCRTGNSVLRAVTPHR